MDVTDQQWGVLEPIFRPRRRPDGRGRPWADPRAVLNGVLWILRTGAPWHDLPRRYPPYQTCHRRFQLWQRSGRLELLLQRLTEDLRDRGKIDVSEAFVDATFAGAKKGAPPFGPTRRGKGSKIMAICDRHGLPVAVHVASASPYEPHLVPATLDARFFADLPPRLIGDRGYDSDALDRMLMTQYGIEMIAPHRRGRRQATQDGRCVRRIKRRWKIERLFAWLHNFRQLVTRWERRVENFLAMLQLACARILLRHL
jgi:transposase